jgi:hypothetical protein
VNRRAALLALGGLASLTPTLGAQSRSAAAERLRFQDLYASFGPLGLQFSEGALRLRGQSVLMQGFLAPPLKPEARFFGLCAQPVSLCPFCQSDTDWPQDIVVVYPRGGATAVFRSASEPVEVAGILELGSRLDRDTGFVSQARIVEATVRRA